MTSASPGHGNHAGKAHATRRIPLAVNGHAPHEPRYQPKSGQAAPKNVEPLPHADSHAPFGIASNTEIARRILRGSEKIVGRTKFGLVARVLWPPPNTAATIAAELGLTTRAVERWMSGEPFNPPRKLLALIDRELFGE